MSLSDKQIDGMEYFGEGGIYYPIKDVKQALKKIKSKRNNGDYIHWNDIVKEIGEELLE